MFRKTCTLGIFKEQRFAASSKQTFPKFPILDQLDHYKNSTPLPPKEEENRSKIHRNDSNYLEFL